MVFNLRERSRAQGSPVKLFLFKGAEPSVESLVRSITLMPGNTEFGYGTTTVNQVKVDEVEGTTSTSYLPLNRLAGDTKVDFVVAVNEMIATFPYLEHVSIIATWFGDDVRCGECYLRPKVDKKDITTSPYEWSVAGLNRETAGQTSQGYEGTPSDRSLYEAIVNLKARGLKVTVHPMIAMDIPADNSLPNPYGGSAQPRFPWRGLITCHPAAGQPGTVDGTTAAADQINAFFGTANASDFGWDATNLRVTYSGGGAMRYERFILHMATLANAAGADDFLIGSQMVSLTNVRGGGTGNNYPAITRLRNLAGKVRSILGASKRISYSADWTEYHAHRVDGNVVFNLDPLWADENIDFVGIANYFPISDWRNGRSHLDWQNGFTSIYDPFYLKSNIEGGEGYDWTYADLSNRDSQTRSPITDAQGKPWVFRIKDLRSWWSNRHYNRTAGVESASPTAWVPQSKQIVFTELGCPAIDKGSNQPHISFDRRMRNGAAGIPYYSDDRPDAAIQRAFLEATLDYWRPENGNNGGMIQWSRISVCNWDVRPYPIFPRYGSYPDAGDWSKGHWLTGRMVPGRAFEVGTFGPYAFCNAETAIVRGGITYQPWPIKHSDMHWAGDLDNSDLEITMARHADFLSEFVAFPPSQVVNLTVFRGHMEDVVTLTDYPAEWLGRVVATEIADEEMSLNCTPVSTSIQRPGLRRNYQLGCPHVLYGPQCRASKAAATISRGVAAFTSATVVLGAPIVANREAFVGGTIEWIGNGGKREIRTIIRVSADGLTLTIRGNTPGMAVGKAVDVVLGCPHNMTGCIDLHNNIANYGGQPFIPLDNPLSQKNQFY